MPFAGCNRRYCASFGDCTFVPLKPAHQAKPATSGAQATGENVASGFGSSAATTLENLGSVGSHIPLVKTVANKVGDVLGLPKLSPNTNPYSAVEQGIKPAQQQATSTTAGKAGVRKTEQKFASLESTFRADFTAETSKLRQEAEKRETALRETITALNQELRSMLANHLEALRHLDMSKRDVPNVQGERPELLR